MCSTAREIFLLEKDAGERALTHRLAVHLESRFGGWDVDCDYNRLGERRLVLPKGSIVSTDDDIGKSVYPDIVVHRRNVPENLLAIEVRKTTNYQPLEHDRHKLRALTDPQLWFAYRIGLLLVLGRKHLASAEVYIGGELNRCFADRFAGPAQGCRAVASRVRVTQTKRPPEGGLSINRRRYYLASSLFIGVDFFDFFLVVLVILLPDASPLLMLSPLALGRWTRGRGGRIGQKRRWTRGRRGRVAATISLRMS